MPEHERRITPARALFGLACFLTICTTLERTVGFSFWNAFFAAWDITETMFWMGWLLFKMSFLAAFRLDRATDARPVSVVECSLDLRCRKTVRRQSRPVREHRVWSAGRLTLVARRQHPRECIADLAASYYHIKTVRSKPHHRLQLATITVRYALRATDWASVPPSDDIWFRGEQPGRLTYWCWRRLNLELRYA